MAMRFILVFLRRLSVALAGLIACLGEVSGQQQVGINTTNPHPAALMDISSTDKGFLIPRMTRSQRDMILTPATGLLVYQWNIDPGFYAFDGAEWIRIGAIGHQLADQDGDTKIQVEASPDEDMIRFDVEGSERAVLHRAGSYTLLNLPNNNGQVGIGLNAGYSFSTFSSLNTAFGYLTLNQLNEGHRNTAFGTEAFYTAFSSDNTGFGAFSGRLNTLGEGNTAAGISSLRNNVTGDSLTAVGYEALFSNTASGNVAGGYWALRGNTTGAGNLGIGHSALAAAASANGTTAIGSGANPAGAMNTAVGAQAGDGQANSMTAIGKEALGGPTTTGNGSTAFGYKAVAGGATVSTTAAGYMALGSSSPQTASNAVAGSLNGGFDNAVAGFRAFEQGLTASAVLGNRAAPKLTNSSVMAGAETFSDTLVTNAIALGYGAGFPGPAWINGSVAIGALATSMSNDVISLGSISGVNGASSSAQVGVGTSSPHASALLHVKSDSLGFLPPRLSAWQVDHFQGPAEGMMVYRQDSLDLMYYDGTQWVRWHDQLSGTYGAIDGETLRFDGMGWSPGYAAGIEESEGLTYATLEETPNADAFHVYLGFPDAPEDSASIEKLVIRENSHGQLMMEFPGSHDQVAIGSQSPGDGNGTTSIGTFAGFYLSVPYNTSMGRNALGGIETGSDNTAIGTLAMASARGAENCVAVGWRAFSTADTTGFTEGTTAVGHNAMNYWGPGISFANPWHSTAIGYNAQSCEACTESSAFGTEATVYDPNAVVLGAAEDILGADLRVNVGIGTSAPEGGLHIRHTSSPASPTVLLEEETEGHVRIKFRAPQTPVPWEIRALPQSLPEDAFLDIEFAALGLHLRGDGNALIDGILMQNSDITLKRDVTPRGGVLDDIRTLHGYRYRWIDSTRSPDLQSGFIAQEWVTAFPEVVGQDDAGMLSMNYPAVAAILLQALKELRQKDRLQADTLAVQEQQILALRARITALKDHAASLRADAPHSGSMTSQHMNQ